MTSAKRAGAPRMSNEAILHELMPQVGSALDRHVATTSEWMPHDYVPYEEGRNFIKEPWQGADSRLRRCKIRRAVRRRSGPQHAPNDEPPES